MPQQREMRDARGFTYLGLLFTVAVMGLALASVGHVWGTIAKREREQELLFIGNEFRQAIGSYYESTPGTKEYPRRLQDLLQDNRYPTIHRHLRKLYVDPMTGKANWGLILQGDQILGVYSQSNDHPLKTGNFAVNDSSFADGGTYAEWQFVYTPYGSPSAAMAALAADQPRVPSGGQSAVPSLSGSETSSEPSTPNASTTIPVEPWVCTATRGNDMQACADAGGSGEADCRRQALQRYRNCIGRSAGANAGQPFGSSFGSGNQ
jgi:type II secretory pathway pseudopilin PulG